MPILPTDTPILESPNLHFLGKYQAYTLLGVFSREDSEHGHLSSCWKIIDPIFGRLSSDNALIIYLSGFKGLNTNKSSVFLSIPLFHFPCTSGEPLNTFLLSPKVREKQILHT